MKNRLLPLVFVLGCYSAYSQVGVGTLNPHEASKLQVFEAKHNKGILIPSVALTGTADATTVKNLDSDANSLLVYNTANVADVTEGYYYWTAADQKWNRIVSAKDLSAAIDSVGGINGIAGAAGAPGTPGAITTLDVIVKDPNGDIYAYVGTKTTAAERSTEWEQKSPNWVKINGLDGRDGKDGIVGGTGAPGSKGETGYPGDNIAMYIDNATGIIYVRDPNNDDKWIALTGKNGIDGIAGAAGAPGTAGSITTLDAIVKDPNGDIYAYVGTDKTVAGRDTEWAAKSPNWVKINGLNGADGIPGTSGAPGTAGSITTLDAIVKDPNGDIFAYVGTDKTVAGRDAEWAAKSPNWVKINGINGADGIPGTTGAPGTAGSITTLDAIVKDPNGDIFAYVGTDKTIAGRDAEWAAKSPNWVKINGLDGKDGKDGIVGGTGAPGSKGEAGYPGDNIAMYIDNATGIIYVRDPNNNDKWIALTGKNGIDGIPGTSGAPGTAGSITTLDAIVKDPNGDIFAYVGTDKTVAGRDTEWAAKSPNWVKINGLNGTDGIPGTSGAPGTAGSITTLDAIVKDPNGDIYAYVGTDKTVAGRDAEWAAKSPNWVKINGINGADGIPGTTGAPGTAGSITTLDAIVKDPNGDIYAYVGTKTTAAERDDEWAAKSPNWVKINGINGADGIPGTTGAPGTAGSITTLDAIVKDPNGDIFAYVGTDKTVAGRDAEWAAKSPNWVKINGINGADGIPGTSGAPGTAGSITTLDAIVKDTNGDIYAYVGTDKTVAGRDAEWAAKSPNWVKINGINGADGIPGTTGAPGTAGSITTLDAIVKDTNGDIYAYVGTDKTVAGRDAEWVAKSPSWVKINNDATGKGSLTSQDGLITIGGTAAGTDILFADAALKINGGAKGQVLTTTDDDGKVEWKNPVSNKLSVLRISSSTTLNIDTDNVIIIDASAVTGNLTLTLPTVTDPLLVGKVFSIKRVDTNDDAFVKVSVSSGTIDEADVKMTIGQSNSYQLILESVAPLKWQTLSKL